jgi:hypothetical protein
MAAVLALLMGSENVSRRERHDISNPQFFSSYVALVGIFTSIVFMHDYKNL